MNSSKRATVTIITFGILTFATSWAMWLLMWGLGIRPTLGPNFSTSPGYLLLMLGAAAPTFAALLMMVVTQGKKTALQLLKNIADRKVSARWYVVAIGLPIGLACITVLLYCLLTHALPRLQIGPILGLFPQFVWTVFLGGPLEEELGWRGFAFPWLQRMMNPLAAALVIGIVWGLWHLPLFVLPGSSQHTLISHGAVLLWVSGFFAQTIVLSLFLSWLIARTKSIIVTILAHASANVAYSVLAVFGLYTAWPALVLYVVLLITAVLSLTAKYLYQMPSKFREITNTSS